MISSPSSSHSSFSTASTAVNSRRSSWFSPFPSSSQGDSTNFHLLDFKPPGQQSWIARILAWHRGTNDIRWSNNPKEPLFQNFALADDFNDKKFSARNNTGQNPNYGYIRLKQNSAFDPERKAPVGLYRGAKPSSKAAYKKLRDRYHVGYIIDLRGGGTTGDKELNWARKTAEKDVKLNYTNLQLSSTVPPSEKQLETFHSIMDEARRKNKSVYIHCKYGVDRTGIMVAYHEKRRLGFTPLEAYKGMKVRGYDITHNLVAPQRVMRINLLGKSRFDGWVDVVRDFVNGLASVLRQFVLGICSHFK